MMTAHQLRLLGIIPLPFLVLAMGYPMYRVLATGKYLRFVGLMYALFAAWGVAFCLFVPVWLAEAFHDKRICDCLPDGPGAAAMLLYGMGSELCLLWRGLGREMGLATSQEGEARVTIGKCNISANSD
jgi:hypothetical protein